MQGRFRLLFGGLIFCGSTLSVVSSATATEPDVASCELVTKEDRSFCQEQIKLQLEVLKTDADKKKLDADRDLAIKTSIIQAIAIAGPILAALIAALYSRKNFLEEKRAGREALIQQEQLQFQLKAAEIALNAIDSWQVLTKAKILSKLFPERLPKQFADDFNPRLLRFGPGGPSFKVDLLRLLAEYPEQKSDLVEYWSLMFPGDRGLKPEDNLNYLWLNELMEKIGKSENQSDVDGKATKLPDA